MINRTQIQFSLFQHILSSSESKTDYKEIDALLDDPAALTSIFVVASYLNIELPYKDISSMKLRGPAKREFLRRYLTGLFTVIMELKTHNCCNIQRKYMKLYRYVLVQSAQTNNYNLLDAINNT